MKVVVLLSGGLDSTTLLASLVDKGAEVYPISIRYGQKHAIEIQSARAVVDHFGLGDHFEFVDLGNLSRIFAGSSLIDRGTKVPHGHYQDASMRSTVVPNRNMVLLSIATARAISIGAREVAYAAHAGDHAIYPDCRPGFVGAMARAIAKAHYEDAGVSLLTPFLHLDKADIVEEGVRVGAPFHLTYSCYEGRQLHCGLCGACSERRGAFKIAGVEDPTRYRPEGRVK